MLWREMKSEAYDYSNYRYEISSTDSKSIRKNHEQNLTGTRQKVTKRRKEVYSMHTQGYCNKRIAEHLGVSLSTVEKDIHAKRNEYYDFINEYQSKVETFVFFEVKMSMDKVISEMFQIAEKAPPGKKSKILFDIFKMQTKIFKFYKDIKYMKKYEQRLRKRHSF